jgi:hypothetical protein
MTDNPYDDYYDVDYAEYSNEENSGSDMFPNDDDGSEEEEYLLSILGE